MITDIVPRRRERHIVDPDTERKLIALGLDSFRQSDLSRYRECPYSYYYGKVLADADDKQVYGTLHTLLGSIFHLAIYFDSEAETEGSNPEWYMHLANMVRQQNPKQVWMHKGEVLSMSTLRSICKLMVEKLDIGMLAVKCMSALQIRKLDIVHQEVSMSYKSGSLTFTGTADMVVRNQHGEYGILDVKTSGLWDPIIRDESVKGKNLSARDVAYHTQLAHYKWLLYKVMKIDAKFQGILLPANGVPLTRKSGNKQAGQDRGKILVTAPCEQQDYEKYLVSWLRSIASNNFYKSFPDNFGTSKCFGCSVFAQCRGADATLNNVEPIELGEEVF